MNDSQSRTSSTGAGATTEELSVVLGRFQSWAAGRKKPSPENLSDKPGKNESRPGNSSALSSDVREISYDQALRASRYRRLDDVYPPDPIPDAPLHATNGQTPIGNRTVKEDSLPPLKRGSEDEDLDLKSRVSRWPEVSFIRAASAVADFPATMRQPNVVSVPLVDPAPAAPLLDAPMSVPASVAQVAAERAETAEQVGLEEPDLRNRQDTLAAANFEVEAETAKASSSHGSRPATTFSEALKRASAKTAHASTRSVCLTLQAADGEQARLQESAAKASLSSAVYLRQCSLGMDDLKVQIEIALSRARREEQGKDGTKLMRFASNIREFGVRCWRRLRRGNTDLPGFSAR
jgi:hypothetical protein